MLESVVCYLTLRGLIIMKLAWILWNVNVRIFLQPSYVDYIVPLSLLSMLVNHPLNPVRVLFGDRKSHKTLSGIRS